MNRLAGDADDFVATLTSNIESVLATSERPSVEMLESEIANRQAEILAIAKKFDRNEGDYTRGATLGKEIDDLRQELITVRRVADEKALLDYKLQSFAETISKPLHEFDTETFRASIDKIIIQNQSDTKTKLCFIFKAGVEMSETI